MFCSPAPFFWPPWMADMPKMQEHFSADPWMAGMPQMQEQFAARPTARVSA